MSGIKRTTLVDLQARRGEERELGDDVGEGDEGDPALREFEATGRLPASAEPDEPRRKVYVGANDRRFLDQTNSRWVYNPERAKVYLNRTVWEKYRVNIVKKLLRLAMYIMPYHDFVGRRTLLQGWQEFERIDGCFQIIERGDIRPGEVVVDEIDTNEIVESKLYHQDGSITKGFWQKKKRQLELLLGRFGVWLRAHPRAQVCMIFGFGLIMIAGGVNSLLGEPNFSRSGETIIMLGIGATAIGTGIWRFHSIGFSFPIPRVAILQRLKTAHLFGRTTPRTAALIDASRCWGVIVAAWLAAEHFVPVWNYQEFPTDNRAFVWYAAFAVIGIAFGAALYIGRKAQGPLDYKLLGRAVLQFGISVGVLIGSAWLGGQLGTLWVDNTIGLIAIWMMITASAKILMLPWLPSMRKLLRR